MFKIVFCGRNTIVLVITDYWSSSDSTILLTKSRKAIAPVPLPCPLLQLTMVKISVAYLHGVELGWLTSSWLIGSSIAEADGLASGAGREAESVWESISGLINH